MIKIDDFSNSIQRTSTTCTQRERAKEEKKNNLTFMCYIYEFRKITKKKKKRDEELKCRKNIADIFENEIYLVLLL